MLSTCHGDAGVYGEVLVIMVRMNLLQGPYGWFLRINRQAPWPS